MAYNIRSEEEYQQVMKKVESYLRIATQKGGFHFLEADQRTDLQVLSKMAEAWEDHVPLMPIPQPKTIVEMLELKMYERNLKQKDLALLLDISPSRLSEVLQSKRRINLELAKRMYKLLQIDPAFILEMA